MTKKASGLCALCGERTHLECGFVRCTNPGCRHTQGMNYAFQERPQHQPRDFYHNRERETEKRVDEVIKDDA